MPRSPPPAPTASPCSLEWQQRVTSRPTWTVSATPPSWIPVTPIGQAAVPSIAPLLGMRQTPHRERWTSGPREAEAREPQSLVWPVKNGDWTAVVMNAYGSAGGSANLSAGATVPGLAWVVGILLSIAGTGLIFAVVLLVIGLRPGRTPSARRPSGAVA